MKTDQSQESLPKPSAPSRHFKRSREVSAGDLVENKDPLLTLVNGNELDVFLELPEQLSGSINPGQAVELTTQT